MSTVCLGSPSLSVSFLYEVQVQAYKYMSTIPRYGVLRAQKKAMDPHRSLGDKRKLARKKQEGYTSHHHQYLYAWSCDRTNTRPLMYRPCVCRCYSSVLPPFLSALFGNGSIIRSFTTQKKEHILSASYRKEEEEPTVKKGGGGFLLQ